VVDPFRAAIAPPRKVWWRRPGFFLFLLASFLAALIVFVQQLDDGVAEPGAPIIYATVESINIEPVDGNRPVRLTVRQAFKVRLPNGDFAYASFAGRDIRGCKIGSAVAIQRGDWGEYVIAESGCSGGDA
jgi:hypothetical protein